MIDERQRKIGRAAANWVLNPIRKWLKDNKTTIAHFPIPPEILGLIVAAEVDGEITKHQARKLFEYILKHEEDRCAQHQP